MFDSSTTHDSGRSMRLAARIAMFAMAFLVMAACAIGAITATADARGLSTTSDVEPDGYMMVAVVGQDGSYVLEPTFIGYENGESAQRALEKSPYQFEFSGGILNSVMGVKPKDGSYSYYHTQGSGMLSGYDASEIASLAISSNSSVGYLDENHVAVLDAVARYENGSRGLHNYPDAVNARKAAQQGFPTADFSAAETLANNLNTAIDAYEEYISGQTYPVFFNVTKGGEPATANIVLTDQYGNETEAQDGTAEVVAGTYSYTAMDESGLNGVKCTKLVVDSSTAESPVAVSMPEQDWFGSIDLKIGQDNDNPCQIVSGSVAERNLTFAVPDAAKSTTDVYVYATASAYLQRDTSYRDTYKVYACYTGTNGISYPNSTSSAITFESMKSAPQNMVEPGIEGNTVQFEIRHALDSDSTTYQIEVCNATIVRCPTLGSLSAVGDSLEHVAGFKPFTTDYSIATTSSTLAFAPKGFAEAEGLEGAEGAYSYTVAGQPLGDDGTCSVSIPQSAYITPYEVPVVVSFSNGTTKTYTVSVTRKDARTVILSHDTDVSVELFNSAGSKVPAASQSAGSSTFGLIEGETYTYIGTKQTYYHVTNSFTASDGLSVAVPAPKTKDLASNIQLCRNGKFQDVDFYASTKNNAHDYTFTVPDTDSVAYVRASVASTLSGIRMVAEYPSRINGSTVACEKTSASGDSYASMGLTGFVRAGGYGNDVTMHVYDGKASSTGAVHYQDYHIKAVRELSFKGMGVSCDTATVAMVQTATAGTDSPKYEFDKSVLDYTVGVPQGTANLDVLYTFTSPTNADDVSRGGYHGTLDGVVSDYTTEAVKQKVTLDPSQEHQVFTVVVSHDDEGSIPQTYTLRVNQLPAVSVSFDKTPSDTTVNVIDNASGSRMTPNSDGTFTLIDTYSYRYTASCLGYKGTSGTFTATDGLNIEVTLEKAAENPDIDPSISAEWPYFRADANNNSVVSTPTPKSSDDALLYWATQVGSGFDKNATGCPILVDNYIYTYAGDKIYKLDTISGEVVKSATMVGISNFAITPMTYAEGMVFVGLSDGRVQAFNAETLESLWVYKSADGGQPNCPIAYSDGKIYTGFWNYSTKTDFVCLTITDEDPTQTQESKIALWEYPNYGGFYWAGAYASENFVVVGSDNSSIAAVLGMEKEESASGTLYSFDPKTGQVLDTITEYPGDVKIGNIRSTPVYDSDTSKMYWVGRGGFFCSVSMNSDGTFDKTTLTVLRLENNNSEGVVSSTTTPVIWNGRAYVGADSGGYTGVDGGHCVDVIDLATNTIAYKIPMGGRSQSSAVCSTAYVDTEGYVYLYFVDNMTPGKIRYFKDKPGQSEPIMSTVETVGNGVDAKQYEVADVLFCPAQNQVQYCICSPICDSTGTIYIKNDSAYMMAIGPKVTSIEVTQQPDRTVYELGETFDPTGMKVTATYSNGKTRDITNYVTYQTEAFEIEGEQTLEIKFPYTMYQNAVTDGNVGTEPDYNFDCPKAQVKLSVQKGIAPTITTESLPTAMAATLAGGTPYSATLEALGTQGQFEWSLEGDLPEGLSFDAATATISGTPARGTGGVYDLRATLTNSQGDASKALQLVVNEVPSVKGGELPGGIERSSYSQKLSTTAGYPEEITSWKLNGGSLPDGLQLDEASGTISGVPTKAGSFTFYVNATNAAGTSSRTRISIDIEAYTEAAAIITQNIGTAKAGSEEPYSVTFSATGVPATFEWTLTGTLPAGMSFDTSTATLSGRPAVGSGGAYPFSVTANNGIGSSTKDYMLWVYEDVKITTQSLASGAVDAEYLQTLAATGYPADFEWSITNGALPAGLALDSKTGTISGTPTEYGSFTFTVKAASVSMESHAEKEFTIEVGYTAPPTITTTSLPDAIVGAAEPYSVQLKAVGMPAEFAWTVAGQLPAGMSFDGATGTLSGTPASGSGGVYELTFTADNGEGTDNCDLSLTVGEAPVLGTTSLTSGSVGQAYSQAVVATGYPAPEITVEGLPEGLTFDAVTSTIEGTPTQDGTSSVTITASNGYGTADDTLSLVVSTREFERLGGNLRTDTMELIVKESYTADHSCDAILVATAWNYADALTASALSGLWDAPLVTTDGGTLSEQAARQIERLANGGTTVYAIGGTGAVSSDVLSAIGRLDGVARTDRIYGDSRILTGNEIYESGVGSWGDTCVIANAWNYADALSIGAYCANNAAPIFGTTDGVLDASQVEAIKSGGFDKVVIVGGSAAVNSSRVKAQIGYDKDYLVLFGETRMDTSAAIVQWECGLSESAAFQPETQLSLDTIAVANAWGYADALAGVNLSVRYGTPILLVDETEVSKAHIDDIIGGASSQMASGWILGGTSAVSPAVEGWLNAALK